MNSGHGAQHQACHSGSVGPNSLLQCERHCKSRLPASSVLVAPSQCLVIFISTPPRSPSPTLWQREFSQCPSLWLAVKCLEGWMQTQHRLTGEAFNRSTRVLEPVPHGYRRVAVLCVFCSWSPSSVNWNSHSFCPVPAVSPASSTIPSTQ